MPGIIAGAPRGVRLVSGDPWVTLVTPPLQRPNAAAGVQRMPLAFQSQKASRRRRFIPVFPAVLAAGLHLCRAGGLQIPSVSPAIRTSKSTSSLGIQSDWKRSWRWRRGRTQRWSQRPLSKMNRLSRFRRVEENFGSSNLGSICVPPVGRLWRAHEGAGSSGRRVLFELPF